MNYSNEIIGNLVQDNLDSISEPLRSKCKLFNILQFIFLFFENRASLRKISHIYLGLKNHKAYRSKHFFSSFKRCKEIGRVVQKGALRRNNRIFLVVLKYF
jgi:hypothetical protein